MTAMSVVAAPDWHRPCDNPKTAYTPGTLVRHRNPELADWAGIVEAPTAGIYAGLHLRYDVCSHHGDEPCVRVRWTHGHTDTGVCVGDALTGWYGVSAINAGAAA